MKVIDAHAHLDTISWVDLSRMRLCDMQAIITPIHLDAAKPVSCQTIQEVWDYLLEVQFGRAEANGIRPYAMIGVSMVSTPADDPEQLFARMPAYLQRKDVVAIGEIGFEPNSKTCKDMAFQEMLIRRQLAIAAAEDICVDFHVPNAPEQKRDYTRETLDICKECDFSMDKVIIDHCSEANIEMVLAAGAWAAISVQPWRKMTAEIAAELIGTHGPERIMVDSDCGGGISDPLAVPKTAVALAQRGFPETDIEKVLYGNPMRCYGLGR